MDISAIRQRLIDARGNRSQTEVAKGLGISVSALSMYEAGERVPRDEVKEQLARYYGLTVGFLFFGEKVHDSCTNGGAAEAVSA